MADSKPTELFNKHSADAVELTPAHAENDLVDLAALFYPAVTDIHMTPDISKNYPASVTSQIGSMAAEKFGTKRIVLYSREAFKGYFGEGFPENDPLGGFNGENQARAGLALMRMSADMGLMPRVPDDFDIKKNGFVLSMFGTKILHQSLAESPSAACSGDLGSGKVCFVRIDTQPRSIAELVTFIGNLNKEPPVFAEGGRYHKLGQSREASILPHEIQHTLQPETNTVTEHLLGEYQSDKAAAAFDPVTAPFLQRARALALFSDVNHMTAMYSTDQLNRNDVPVEMLEKSSFRVDVVADLLMAGKTRIPDSELSKKLKDFIDLKGYTIQSMANDKLGAALETLEKTGSAQDALAKLRGPSVGESWYSRWLGETDASDNFSSSLPRDFAEQKGIFVTDYDPRNVAPLLRARLDRMQQHGIDKGAAYDIQARLYLNAAADLYPELEGYRAKMPEGYAFMELPPPDAGWKPAHGAITVKKDTIRP